VAKKKRKLLLLPLLPLLLLLLLTRLLSLLLLLPPLLLLLLPPLLLLLLPLPPRSKLERTWLVSNDQPNKKGEALLRLFYFCLMPAPLRYCSSSSQGVPVA
jgi:hypothetical protein